MQNNGRLIDSEQADTCDENGGLGTRWRGKGIEPKRIKREKIMGVMDMDNSVRILEVRGLRKVEEDIGGINDGGQRLDWGW